MRVDAWKETVKRLDDRFGNYLLTVKCPKCGHTRTMEPVVLANIVGWKAEISAVMARMVCSKCRAKGATYQIEKIPRPRGRGDR